MTALAYGYEVASAIAEDRVRALIAKEACAGGSCIGNVGGRRGLKLKLIS